MSNVNELFKKLERMPLEELLNLCAIAIQEKMPDYKLDTILLLLETRLQKYRIMKQLRVKNE